MTTSGLLDASWYRLTPLVPFTAAPNAIHHHMIEVKIGCYCLSDRESDYENNETNLIFLQKNNPFAMVQLQVNNNLLSDKMRIKF